MIDVENVSLDKLKVTNFRSKCIVPIWSVDFVLNMATMEFIRIKLIVLMFALIPVSESEYVISPNLTAQHGQELQKAIDNVISHSPLSKKIFEKTFEESLGHKEYNDIETCKNSIKYNIKGNFNLSSHNLISKFYYNNLYLISI